jgi:methylmalonyl-CoA carboxyltransferase 5S subunit
MFPQVAPKFFKSRGEGRKNLGKDPSKKAPTPETKTEVTDAASGGKASGAAVNYVITLNGKEHRVTVAPGQ